MLIPHELMAILLDKTLHLHNIRKGVIYIQTNIITSYMVPSGACCHSQTACAPVHNIHILLVKRTTAIPLTTVSMHIATDLFESIAESFEDLLHVASLLHGNHPGVVFLIHPDQEGFAVVVPDPSGIWPISSHPRGQQQRGHRLVKQKVVLESGGK